MYKLLNSIYNRIKGVGRMKKTYTIIVHKEDDILWAECLELEGCFAQAKSLEELKKLMIESIYLYFHEDVYKLRKNENKDEIILEMSYA